MNINEKLSKELDITLNQVQNVIELLDQGNTVPFIARYRKEITGGMDDTKLRLFNERLIYIRNLEDRKNTVIKTIDEIGKLTDELKLSIENAETLTEVEDLYRPFKPKKRTKATIAIEKGLQGLADFILSGAEKVDALEEGKKYINEEKGVLKSVDAVEGACNIIAETVSDDADIRKWMRAFLNSTSFIETSGSNEKSTPYEMYYEYKEKVKTIPGHRILAINRGENEGVLKVKIACNMDEIKEKIKKKYLKENEFTDKYVSISIDDSLKRLLYPSVEREIRNEMTERAEEGAIKIFKENLKSLLMQQPIKGKVVLGYDPGFRTGCKLAVLDPTGKLLDIGTIYPTVPQNDVDGAIRVMKALVYKYNIEIVSLGNGTASRESEIVLERLIKEVHEEKKKNLSYVVVSESGASVYSASELAAKEYPNIDVSIRGAISIGRRVQDPLAELVKIDPKSIGVGQYQHDINSKALDESLKGVVEACVNSVGIDLNIATPSLLNYVAGISPAISENIVSFRNENGIFKNRNELLNVKRLGPKVFEQCAGFLRIPESDEILDNTSVHPESYKQAKELLNILGINYSEVKRGELKQIDKGFNDKKYEELSAKLGIGIPTLKDIVKEISKPGRDPREDLPKPIFKTGVMDISHLKPGMRLLGTIRNVADFGAFVDIGVHQDGLIHISQLSSKFIKHPLDVVKVGDIVEVEVLEIDDKRKRIGLTMRFSTL
ncbi:MAG: RNA-binding transcriptional accessory protein [Oscillospiraceae bacterium]|nr:RNA-binding transcriptional accessory protein [Oscillospiraceae bacterium]